MISLNDVFKIDGFVPNPERDRDYIKQGNETVSQVQGCPAFCEKFIQWTEQNPGCWPDLKAALASPDETSRTNALILIAKTVGHIFNFPDKFSVAKNREYQFVGFSETFVIPRVLSRWNAFAKKGLVSPETHAFVADALFNAVWHDNCSKKKLQETLENIHDPIYRCRILVGSGWIWHSTYVIFYKDPNDTKDEIRIGYCNRGADCANQSGIVFLKIKDKSKITLEFLQILANRIKVDHSQYMSLKEIKAELGAEEISYIPMKKQKSGNCTYSNLKAAIYTLLLIKKLGSYLDAFLLIQKSSVRPKMLELIQEQQKTASDAYKLFVAYDANQTLEELSQDFPFNEMLLAPLSYYQTMTARICQLFFCKKPKKVYVTSLQKLVRSMQTCPYLKEAIDSAIVPLLSQHVAKLVKDRLPLTPLVLKSYFSEPIADYSLITKLDLKEMYLKEFPNQITVCTQLTELDLYSNQLQCIPPAIRQFTALRYLSLVRNQLSDDLKGIKHLTNLTRIALSGNKIKAFPSKLARLTHLKQLSLGSNLISEIPETIGYLVNLRELGLNYNRIKAIPPEIRSLTNLEFLYLGGNQITSIPLELFQSCTRLSFLGLESNLIKSLPKEVGNLTNLINLDLRQNQLIVIPLTITQCSKLRYLQLDGNKIIKIPDTLHEFFGKNRITSFTPNNL